jgi:hypothetical protein
LSYAELSTAEASLDARDFRLYTLIWHGDVELTEDGDSAIFTREWIDDAWLRRRSAQYAKDPNAPYPGSLEEFVDDAAGIDLGWNRTGSGESTPPITATPARTAKSPGERFSKLHPSCLTSFVAKRLHGVALCATAFGQQIARGKHPAEVALKRRLA